MSLFVAMRFSSGAELQAVVTLAVQTNINVSWEDSVSGNVMETVGGGARLRRVHALKPRVDFQERCP